MLDAELPFTPVKIKAQKSAAAEALSDLIVFSPLPPSGEKWRVTWNSKYINYIHKKTPQKIPGIQSATLELYSEGMNMLYFVVELTKIFCNILWYSHYAL